MGITIDIILVAIVLISTIIGFKKGLVKLGVGFLSGILAIILTIVLYTPISKAIIDNTEFDEKIESIFIKNANKIVEKENKDKDNYVINTVTDKVKNEAIPQQAKNISEYAVRVIVAIVLYIVCKIILRIIITLLDLVAKLPILKQFNQAGGLVYGLFRGIVFSFIIIMGISLIAKINPENSINTYLEQSYISEFVTKNILKF